MTDERPVRLHCFAHAGAGVSAFYGWGPRLGAGVETVPHLLPGRERRRREARLTRPADLIDDLLGHFTTQDRDVPYVLYGHSLGALVAYTLTRALHEAGLPGPSLLVVGACPPPDALSDLSNSCRAGDEDLLHLLDEVGALPRGAQPGGLWHRAVLPVLRDDLVLAHELRAAAREPSPAGPLGVPVLAVAGADDPLAQPRAMARWRLWTTGRFTARTVPGDHFFVRGPELPRLVGRAARVVRRLTPEPAGVSS